MAKKLYTTNRDRPDTCTSVTILNTRVRGPDTDDSKKLAHLTKYLRKTRNLPLILGVGDTVILKRWIDASFAVHPNIIGNTH